MSRKRWLTAIGILVLVVALWAPDEIWPGKGPLACYGETLRVRWTLVRLWDLDVKQEPGETIVTVAIDRWGFPWTWATLIDNQGNGAQPELMPDGRYRFRMPSDVGLMEIGVASGKRRGWLFVPGPAGNPCR